MIKIVKCPKGWAGCCFATEITEFIEKNSKVSAGSVAKPMKLDTPKDRRGRIYKKWVTHYCMKSAGKRLAFCIWRCSTKNPMGV